MITRKNLVKEMALIDPTRWAKPHDRLAKDILRKFEDRGLGNLPKDMMDWIKVARPYVDGKERDFLLVPFWIPIYQDTSNYQMVVGGRQIYKSTACTDFLAASATQESGVQICYVTYDEESKRVFSKQRFKIGTLLNNPILSKYIRHPGNVGEISLKNNSTIYLLTDNYEYKHLEGKSPSLCLLDEAQYQDLQHYNKVTQTMMETKGKTKIFGIGGESGSPYEKLWRQTNQMEWVYDYSDWRDRLQFDHNGLVKGEYLKDVLKGKWVPKNPDVKDFNGYHIPQTIFPTRPLTEEDAIFKYKIHPRFSIEYQKKKLSASEFTSHVLGGFYNAPHRPITQEMIERCTVPYRYLSFFSGKDVSDLKYAFGDDITIAMGVDFGSGKSSYTAIAILIKWKKSDRIQHAHLEKRPPENQIMQAEYIVDLFNNYSCDIGVGDLGYGQNQVKVIQKGGFRQKNGIPFAGLTDSRFFGYRTISDFTKPIQKYHVTMDEHGEEVGRIQGDKTASIELLINCMDNLIPHPLFPTAEKIKRSCLMIPSMRDYEIDYLLEDFNNVTRKDTQYLDDVVADPRERPRKEFNHPPDSVMAIVYGLIGFEHLRGTRYNWISV